MKMTLKGAFGFTALSLLIPCVVLGLQAGCTTRPSTAAQLQLLQGTWEGAQVGGEKNPKINMTNTGHSLHFYIATNDWFETTFTLPAGTDPQQIHATIQRARNPGLIGTVVDAIFKMEDGTLTFLVGEEELPKSFEAKKASSYAFRKVQPQKKNTQPPKTK
jgi:hypothetical protein